MQVSSYRPLKGERCLLTALASVAMQACLASASFGATPEATPTCEEMTDAAAKELTERVEAALKSQHPDHVTRLFTSDAILKGFGSPVIRADYASIRNYFLYFLQFAPALTFDSRKIETGCNFAIDSGTYVWTLKPRDAATSSQYPLPARYRMTMEKIGDIWLISELIEEPKDADAAQTAAQFALPPPQATQTAEPIAATVPAVAGYIKRGSDELMNGEAGKISKPGSAARKAAPSGDGATWIDGDKTATYLRWFDFGR